MFKVFGNGQFQSHLFFKSRQSQENLKIRFCKVVYYYVVAMDTRIFTMNNSFTVYLVDLYNLKF